MVKSVHEALAACRRMFLAELLRTCEPVRRLAVPFTGYSACWVNFRTSSVWRRRPDPLMLVVGSAWMISRRKQAGMPQLAADAHVPPVLAAHQRVTVSAMAAVRRQVRFGGVRDWAAAGLAQDLLFERLSQQVIDALEGVLHSGLGLADIPVPMPVV